MGTCEVCGNTYDKAFQVTTFDGEPHTFDSFECAVHMLAPRCDHCGVKIIGHGLEANGTFYCWAFCASQKGVEKLNDRV